MRKLKLIWYQFDFKSIQQPPYDESMTSDTMSRCSTTNFTFVQDERGQGHAA